MQDFLKFVNDATTRDGLEALPLTKFWSKMNELYPSVAEVLVRALLMFSSTNLCEHRCHKPTSQSFGQPGIQPLSGR